MGPGLTYKGRLGVDGDPLDLVVDLRIEGGAVEVRTARESLGVWPSAQVSVSRLDDGRFVLQLGDEQAFFQAEDPLAFSFEAAAALTMDQSRFRHRLRAFLPKGGGEPRPAGAAGQAESLPRLQGVFAAQRAADASREPTPRGRHLRSAGQGA